MIRTEPMGHQTMIHDFAASKKFAGIFAEYGTGKTLCALMIANTLRLKRILVVSTKLSVKSVWPTEIRKHTNFRWAVLVGSKRKKAKLLYHAMKMMSQAGGTYHSSVTVPTIFLVNYDGVKNIYNEIIRCPWDAIVLDECFVKGTLVECEDETRPIEKICVGQRVKNAIGVGKVVSTSTKEVYELACVRMTDGTVMYCSTHHPFFTSTGWVLAKNLDEGAYVCSQEEVMQSLQTTNEMVSSPPRQESLLQPYVLNEIKMEIEKVSREAITDNECWAQEISRVWINEGQSSIKSYTTDKFGEATFSRSQKKIIREVKRKYASNSWRQRSNNSDTSTTIVQTIRKGVGVRNTDWIGEKKERMANTLYDRYCECQKEDRSRSRWQQPQIIQSSTEGQDTRQAIEGKRVESITIQKQGDPDFDRFSGGKDTIVLYDLQVNGHPSYVVNGCLVHNSTKIKSPTTMRTKIMWDIGKRIPRRYIMTGFPVTENLADLYAQIKFLDDTNILGTSYHAFLNEYFVKMGVKTLPKKKKTKELLKKISSFCVHVTNEKLKLPPKMYKKIDIELTAKQQQLLDGFKKTFQLELGKVKIDTQYIFTLITKSLEICDGYIKDADGNLEVVPTNKDEALVELLEEMDAKYHKTVIWAAHRFTIKKLYRILTKLGYGTLKLTGETEDEDLVVKRFQYDKRYPILLATQKKAAESVTLTASRHAIYYSNTWSYDLRANSEARIRRKGSERHESILYTDLITNSSVETKVYDCLRKKGNLIAELKAHFRAIKSGDDDDE